MSRQRDGCKMGGDFATSPTHRPSQPASQPNRVGRTISRSRRYHPSNGYSGLVAAHCHTPVASDEIVGPNPANAILRAVILKLILCVG